MQKLQFFKPFFVTVMLSCCFIMSFAQQVDYARKVIRVLASPAFKGRGYVENGDQRASAFIADEFKKFGLLPLNEGSYFQYFDIAVNTFPGTVKVALDGKLLTTAVDYLIDAGSPAIKGNYPVIAVKRSDLQTAEKFKALLLKVTNAFVLVDQRFAAEETATEKKTIDQHLQLLAGDEKLSLAGLILYTTEKLTWTTTDVQRLRPVITICNKELDPARVKQITLHVDAKFLPAYNTRNVAAMVKGSSGKDSTLMITAHYDHLGLLGKKVYFPGANDNASGVAMLLSIASHYAHNPPEYDMVFVAFSAEEMGLLGSRAFIEQPLTDLRKVKFLVNFDLAGTGDEGIRVVNGAKFKSQFDRLVALNKQYQLLPKVDIRGEACNSDHCYFYKLGVPSFFIYTQGGIKAYHDVYDRAETLPLTVFEAYHRLMIKFLDSSVR